MRFVACLVFLNLLAGAAMAQEANVGFGTVAADPDAPVEVTAETLNVTQDDGSAVFSGNVVVGQGNMRMTAPRVKVIYSEEGNAVERLEATGGVTLVSDTEAAEAERADYNVDTGIIVMTGDVLLTQGRNALTSDRMEVDIRENTARMTGRVKTVLYQGDEEQQN